MTRVWLAGSVLTYPVGGHFWVYLNWTLGFAATGAQVVYLEHVVDPDEPKLEEAAERVRVLFEAHGMPVPVVIAAEPFRLDDLSPDDVLVSLDKTLPVEVVTRFRRSAVIDIDPGITQGWIALGEYDRSAYDAYFTIGEGTAKRANGIHWQYVPPCVALDHWPVTTAEPDGAFTTVTHWNTPNRWYFDGEELHPNDKTLGFRPYLDVPQSTSAPVELAMPFDEIDSGEARDLERRGWRLRDARELDSPAAFRGYVQGSLGEFSCAKPAYVALETAWFSDRTVCYLASGKPAVVQHTGPSAFLPDRGAIFRFRTPAEAAECLDAAFADYDENCRLARRFAEEHFDARKAATRVLEAL